ncbi:putative homing endonuclease [Klebsiella phage CPRSB]|nr:putative homing endonuclease [Klebsiella phage CPRSB]
MANGYLPLIIDHKHGVECGDGIGNLQEATQSQNSMKKIMSRNKSGFREYPLIVTLKNGERLLRLKGKQKIWEITSRPKKPVKCTRQKPKNCLAIFISNNRIIHD